MYERITALIGDENLKKIQSKNILVLGLGGVGGYVVESLVRSGIQKLTIVDKDSVDITNLNRQIIALKSTVGEKKIDVFKRRILDINDSIDLTCMDTYLTKDNIRDMKLEDYDYIVDAIDDVDVKVELIKYSIENDLNLISSMGTAKKLHPECLSITTLDKTEYDHLAKKIRSKLRGYKLNKVRVLSSKECAIKTEGNVLGSCMFVPASAGIMISSYIVNDIIK